MGLHKHDLKKFQGVNLQECAGTLSEFMPPSTEKVRLALYLIELSEHEPVWHEFYTVLNSLTDLLERKTERIAFGSTCSICGNKMKVVIQWEKDRPLGEKTPIEE